MSVILTESAAITKSSGINGFNGDNMNLNGRAISVQDADNGSKAAGVVKPPYVCAVTSYSAKGAASGAASAFNDYSYSIFENRKNALPSVKKYFDDMDIVSSGFGKDVLSAGVLCISERSVIAAVKGNTEILRYSENKLTTLKASDDEIGFNTYTDLHNCDYYVILGAKCSRSADKKVISEILSEAPDVKLALQRIFRSVYATCKHNDCTILVVRIKTDYSPENHDSESDTYSGLDPLSLEFGQSSNAKKKIGAVSMGELKPVRPAAGKKTVSDKVKAEEKTEKDVRTTAYTPESDTEAAEESAASDNFDIYFEDIDDDDFEEETKSVGKKLLGLLPFAVLLILIAIIAVMFLFPKDDGENPNTPADVSSLDSIQMTTTKKTKPTKTAETETTTAEEETTTEADEENNQTTAPVTEAPETQPSTRPPTTNPPTTNPPTTRPPTTQPPTTQPPTTQPPTTEPPTTQPPTTEPPTTQPPETTRLTDIPDQRD